MKASTRTRRLSSSKNAPLPTSPIVNPGRSPTAASPSRSDKTSANGTPVSRLRKGGRRVAHQQAKNLTRHKYKRGSAWKQASASPKQGDTLASIAAVKAERAAARRLARMDDFGKAPPQQVRYLAHVDEPRSRGKTMKRARSSVIRKVGSKSPGHRSLTRSRLGPGSRSTAALPNVTSSPSGSNSPSRHALIRRARGDRHTGNSSPKRDWAGGGQEPLPQLMAKNRRKPGLRGGLRAQSTKRLLIPPAPSSHPQTNALSGPPRPPDKKPHEYVFRGGFRQSPGLPGL